MLLSPAETMLDPALRVLSLPLQQFDGPPEMLGAGAGLPAGALYIQPANLILAGTPCDTPLFRDIIAGACVRFGADVVLVRTGLFPETLNPVTVDMAFLRPESALVVTNLAFMRAQDGGLWLVPPQSGPSFEIRPDGLAMQIEPPFLTWSERCDGTCRAAAEIVRIVTRRQGR